MTQGYIKEAAYQFSILYLPGKCFNSWVLRSIIEVSSMGSKRTLVVPGRSFGSFWHNGCLKDTSRKLYINFQFYTCPESAPTPGFSRASSKCHPWSLRGRWWFLRGVLVVFDIMNVPYIHSGRSISIFRALAVLEMPNLLSVSRKSFWSLRGRSWLLRIWLGVAKWSKTQNKTFLLLDRVLKIKSWSVFFCPVFFLKIHWTQS